MALKICKSIESFKKESYRDRWVIVASGSSLVSMWRLKAGEFHMTDSWWVPHPTLVVGAKVSTEFIKSIAGDHLYSAWIITFQRMGWNC